MKNPKLYLQVFTSFFKISATTFGGGLAMIPQLKSEFVEKRKWLDEEEMLDLFATAQLLPGVIFINVACIYGIRICGTIGAVIATVGLLLPALLSLGIFLLFIRFINQDILEKIFKGIISGVVGIMIVTLIMLLKKHIKNILSFFILILSFAFMQFFNVNVYYILIIGVICGIIYYFILRRRKNNA